MIRGCDSDDLLFWYQSPDNAFFPYRFKGYTLDIVPSHVGRPRYVLTSPAGNVHSLDVANTDFYRLRAHWSGFVGA